jgi:hypothetical protein
LKKVASNRKGWKHKDLGNAVADRIVKSAVDMDTGEITMEHGGDDDGAYY